MRARIFFAMALAMFFLTGVTYAEDFSADVVSISGSGTFTAKIYVSGEKSRMEMPDAVTINRMDKKVAWMLLPGQKVCMEQPVNPRMTAGTSESVTGEVARSVEGDETVNGLATTKYRVMTLDHGKTEQIFQWVDKATHIPVKTAAVDGSWSTEFKNIRTGPQDPSLFEIPPDYQNLAAGMPGTGDMRSMMDKLGKKTP